MSEHKLSHWCTYAVHYLKEDLKGPHVWYQVVYIPIWVMPLQELEMAKVQWLISSQTPPAYQQSWECSTNNLMTTWMDGAGYKSQSPEHHSSRRFHSTSSYRDWSCCSQWPGSPSQWGYNSMGQCDITLDLCMCGMQDLCLALDQGINRWQQFIPECHLQAGIPLDYHAWAPAWVMTLY